MNRRYKRSHFDNKKQKIDRGRLSRPNLKKDKSNKGHNILYD